MNLILSFHFLRTFNFIKFHIILNYLITIIYLLRIFEPSIRIFPRIPLVHIIHFLIFQPTL